MSLIEGPAYEEPRIEDTGEVVGYGEDTPIGYIVLPISIGGYIAISVVLAEEDGPPR
jgi:hypothetical protein